MEIRKAVIGDIAEIILLDKHIESAMLMRCIEEGRIYIVCLNKLMAGYLRYGYLYDSFPFLNIIYLKDEFRGRGLGTSLMERWESDMKEMGYNIIYLSTQSDESAQHFYRKRGYEDIGAFKPPEQKAMEIMMCKRIKK
ncbi:MAG: GNAT family N-acetyltransferase [Clostridia bacterium]|nr:GNAT family N-acetyltransferase [Clostridia bacterium]MBN2883339.1 GNAT family N-acetyltransferase [Clostridia bacterium]